MRDLQRRNDAADRHLEDRRRSSLLRVLDLRSKGQDGLQGSVDGEARHTYLKASNIRA
jgi:hypothetical protein